MIKVIETKGTHEQIGKDIGESLRAEIHNSLDIHYERFLKQKEKDSLKNFFILTKTVKKLFPDFFEEIKGMAKGANISEEKLLFFSFEEELSPGEKCTTLAVRGEKTIFFAHNEDWDIRLPFYVVKAKPNKKPSFTSVAYAGHFPGTIFGYNSQGILFSGNSIDTKPNFKGVPKTFFLRKFLECSSILEILKNVKNKKRTIGNNSVIVSTEEDRLVSLEWSSNKVDLLESTGGISHSNHYLSNLKKYQNSKTSKSSAGRYLFAQEAVLKMNDRPSLIKIKKIMKSHVSSKVSICGHKLYKTLTSIIVDTARRKMWLTEGNPCEKNYKTVDL